MLSETAFHDLRHQFTSAVYPQWSTGFTPSSGALPANCANAAIYEDVSSKIGAPLKLMAGADPAHASQQHRASLMKSNYGGHPNQYLLQQTVYSSVADALVDSHSRVSGSEVHCGYMMNGGYGGDEGSSGCSNTTDSGSQSGDQLSPHSLTKGHVANLRYKTEKCRSYEETGLCKYGEKCQFAHGDQEMRPLQRHQKYKTEMCRTYHSSGYCPYGYRCHFIHKEIPPTAIVTSSGGHGPPAVTPRAAVAASIIPSNDAPATSSDARCSGPVSLPYGGSYQSRGCVNISPASVESTHVGNNYAGSPIQNNNCSIAVVHPNYQQQLRTCGEGYYPTVGAVVSGAPRDLNLAGSNGESPIPSVGSESPASYSPSVSILEEVLVLGAAGNIMGSGAGSHVSGYGSGGCLSDSFCDSQRSTDFTVSPGGWSSASSSPGSNGERSADSGFCGGARDNSASNAGGYVILEKCPGVEVPTNYTATAAPLVAAQPPFNNTFTPQFQTHSRSTFTAGGPQNLLSTVNSPPLETSMSFPIVTEPGAANPGPVFQFPGVRHGGPEGLGCGRMAVPPALHCQTGQNSTVPVVQQHHPRQYGSYETGPLPSVQELDRMLAAKLESSLSIRPPPVVYASAGSSGVGCGPVNCGLSSAAVTPKRLPIFSRLSAT